ncbi:hypothetical protein ACGRH2_01670 [Vibrio barjaei]|jgi:hypothetical protein|uniref:Uncharacterized protein n=1 Tax=Vibrio barjaei TaxID=1676683 RepID=A0ABW7IC65_9VIBR
MFKGIKNNMEKAKAASIIQNIFEVEIKNGFLIPHQLIFENVVQTPAQFANNVVEIGFSFKKDMLSGSFGKRPHKLVLAAFSLAFYVALRWQKLGADCEYDDSVIFSAKSLGMLFNELEVNEGLYELSKTDYTIIEMAAQLVKPFMEHIGNDSILDEIDAHTPQDNDEDWASMTWELWYSMYTMGAVKGSDEAGGRGLVMNEEGMCLVDLLDHDPLKRAHRDGVNPAALGYQYGQQFDITKIKGMEL